MPHSSHLHMPQPYAMFALVRDHQSTTASFLEVLESSMHPLIPHWVTTASLAHRYAIYSRLASVLREL